KIRGLQSYHTAPHEIGRIAREARAGTLVISHLMPGSVAAELVTAASAQYAGPVVVGEDLMEV
ncbi:MAG TPA: MBL fold metallo-hydrolase, partial [Candidatus Limnocylindria bacterium]|nr:MBL fold metallo-hydrolase [Candidatus Limnocylindria bacterium]